MAIYSVRRNVFGANVGPRQVVPANAAGNADTSSSRLYVYEGIQVRAKPLNVTVTPSTLTQSTVRTPSSPILKAQLSSPSPPNVIKKEVKSKVRLVYIPLPATGRYDSLFLMCWCYASFFRICTCCGVSFVRELRLTWGICMRIRGWSSLLLYLRYILLFLH